MTKNTTDTKAGDHKVYCAFCKGKRNQKTVQTYIENAEMYAEGGDIDFFWHAKYHVIKCSGCDTVAFLLQYGDEDTWDIINGEREWTDIYTVYPEEPKEVHVEDPYFEKYKLKVKIFKHAPENINNLYKQIVESYNNKHFILTTSGLRTLVEGICAQLNIKKGYMYDEEQKIISINDDGNQFKAGSLGGKIFGLFEKGYIIFTQALILQQVKEIGNAATHDIETPDFKEVKEIIHILEKVMYDIYELKEHTLLIPKV